MFKEVFMNATWLASAILALVGILKMPFKSFKEKKPKLYRATFFIISLVLVIGGSVIVDMFLLEESILSWTFALLLVSTGFVVFGGYTTYECTGLKAGLNKLFATFKNWITKYSDSKVAKFIKKIGMDRIVTVNEAIISECSKSKETEVATTEEVAQPTTMVLETTNAEVL